RAVETLVERRNALVVDGDRLLQVQDLAQFREIVVGAMGGRQSYGRHLEVLAHERDLLERDAAEGEQRVDRITDRAAQRRRVRAADEAPAACTGRLDDQVLRGQRAQCLAHR